MCTWHFHYIVEVESVQVFDLILEREKAIQVRSCEICFRSSNFQQISVKMQLFSISTGQ